MGNSESQSSTRAQVRPHRHEQLRLNHVSGSVATLHTTPVTHTPCWGSPPDLKHNTAQRAFCNITRVKESKKWGL